MKKLFVIFFLLFSSICFSQKKSTLKTEELPNELFVTDSLGNNIVTCKVSNWEEKIGKIKYFVNFTNCPTNKYLTNSLSVSKGTRRNLKRYPLLGSKTYYLEEKDIDKFSIENKGKDVYFLYYYRGNLKKILL